MHFTWDATLNITTICRQYNRMPNIRKFAVAHDLDLFVCGRKSSNGKILYQECKKMHPNSYLIDQPEEIDRNLLEKRPFHRHLWSNFNFKWLMEECKKAILNENRPIKIEKLSLSN